MCYQHESQLVQSPMAPADARQIVRRMCNELHVEDLAETAMLLTSELVTNAIRHAPGPLQLGVACAHGELVVSVQDADPQPPRPRNAQSREVGGRGLTLVDRMAERWGCRQVPNAGKAVWFSLRPLHPPALAQACTCPPEGAEAAPIIPASRNGG